MTGGLRLQFFVALAVAVIGAALVAALVAAHVFDRELERAYEARLRLLVADTGRVLDAGIAAGLDLGRPQLLERSLRTVRLNLGADEVIAVVDEAGRIVASTNPAEIGETAPPRWLVPAGRSAADALEPVIISRPVQSLFGAPAGHVVARLAASVLDQPRAALLAKITVGTAAITALALLVAALAAAVLPWRARRAARALDRMMHDLYEQIGKGGPGVEPPRGLPRPLREPVARFAAAVRERDQDLAMRVGAVDSLDEAA